MKKRYKVLSQETMYPKQPEKVITSYATLDKEYSKPIQKETKKVEKKRPLDMNKPSDVELYWRRRARTKAYNRKVNGITLFTEDIAKEFPNGATADEIYHRYHKEHGISVASANTYHTHLVTLLKKQAVKGE